MFIFYLFDNYCHLGPLRSPLVAAGDVLAAVCLLVCEQHNAKRTICRIDVQVLFSMEFVRNMAFSMFFGRRIIRSSLFLNSLVSISRTFTGMRSRPIQLSVVNDVCERVFQRVEHLQWPLLLCTFLYTWSPISEASWDGFNSILISSQRGVPWSHMGPLFYRIASKSNGRIFLKFDKWAGYEAGKWWLNLGNFGLGFGLWLAHLLLADNGVWRGGGTCCTMQEPGALYILLCISICLNAFTLLHRQR